MASYSAFGLVPLDGPQSGDLSFEEVCRFVEKAEDSMATPSSPVQAESFSEILNWLNDEAATVVPTASIHQPAGFNDVLQTDAMHPPSNGTLNDVPGTVPPIVTDEGAAAHYIQPCTPNATSDDPPGPSGATSTYDARSMESVAAPESSSGSDGDSCDSSPTTSSPIPSTHTPPVSFLGSVYVLATPPGDDVPQPQPTENDEPPPRRRKKELPNFKRVELDGFNDMLTTNRIGPFPVRQLQERARGVSGIDRKLWEIRGKLTQMRQVNRDRRRAEMQAQMETNGIVLDT